MRLLTVVGARPQFIKAATISRMLEHRYPEVEEIIVHTGQHYDTNMSEIFFNELDIPRPRYNLSIGGGSHGYNTGRMLEALDVLLATERPDWVLVYGDTDSTLAGALGAAKQHIPVAHIEAGLRSFNRRMPEEINRRLVDHMADILFAPTEIAHRNLLREGIAKDKIYVVGDVMYDASVYYKSRARQPEWFESIGSSEFILCTIHRAENTDNKDRLQNILSGLSSSPWPIILPLHPRTRKKITQFNLEFPQIVYAVEPVSYLEMAWLEAHCEMVITDSGGVQKEAYFHRRPCLTLRDETEWVELIEEGVNELVGANADKIKKAIKWNKIDINFDKSSLYGDGSSAKSIVDILINY